MDWLFDRRTNCWSVMTTMTVGVYTDLVSSAHEAQGSLSGQRGVLTTTTARRIRDRMVSDLKLGAVLPPVVIGVVLPSEKFNSLPIADSDEIGDFVPEETSELSIIDGMQRTASLIEASEADPDLAQREMRVEFWLTDNVRAMIYRMLILNTGQVPWTISRQLSVVFQPLLAELEARVPELAKISTPDNPKRRVGPAQYSSDSLVELYIAFSLRKTAVDSKEAISDEFSRLDFVDNLADPQFQTQFYGVLSMLASLDTSFSRLEGTERTPAGKYVFDRQPARIGFIVALGLAILGRPGADRTPEQREEALAELTEAQKKLTSSLDAIDQGQLLEFMSLEVLQEVLDKRVGQVGRYERSVFLEAFRVLVEENFELKNMEPCWRAS